MSIIKLPIRYEGSKGEKILYSSFDNQVGFSCINAVDAAEIAQLTPLRKPKTVLIEGELIEANYVCLLDFYITELLFRMNFWLSQIFKSPLFLVQQPSENGAFSLIINTIRLILKKYIIEFDCHLGNFRNFLNVHRYFKPWPTYFPTPFPSCF